MFFWLLKLFFFQQNTNQISCGWLGSLPAAFSIQSIDCFGVVPFHYIHNVEWKIKFFKTPGCSEKKSIKSFRNSANKMNLKFRERDNLKHYNHIWATVIHSIYVECIQIRESLTRKISVGRRELLEPKSLVRTDKTRLTGFQSQS